MATSSIFDLRSPWGVARLLVLRVVPPRHHLSEGVRSAITKLGATEIYYASCCYTKLQVATLHKALMSFIARRYAQVRMNL